MQHSLTLKDPYSIFVDGIMVQNLERSFLKKI